MEEVQVTSRAVIFRTDDNKKKLVTIKRTFFGQEKDRIYYTLPGGHVELGESYEDTVVREVEEELGIQIKINCEMANLFVSDINREEKFFECEYLSGTWETGTGVEFTQPDYEKYGKYEIEYIDIQELEQYPLLPEEVKKIIIQKYKT